MKTLVLLPLAVILFAAGCKKHDTPQPVTGERVDISINASDDLYRSDSRTNGADIVSIDPLLHFPLPKAAILAHPANDAVVSKASIDLRRKGDFPVVRPTGWEKAPQPSSKY